MNIPAELKYTKDHEWLKIEGNVATLGISDYAQMELGDIVNVELPDEGDEYERDDSIGAVESVKASSEIFTPVSGKILEINDPLMDAPETINDDPYEEGWMVKIELSNLDELEKLMDAVAYEAYIQEESR